MNYTAKGVQNGGGSVSNFQHGSQDFIYRQRGSNNEPPMQDERNSPRLIQPHPCVLCHKSSVCICQRCGDYYCSLECQRRDWNRHRYICMPMPQLVQASFATMNMNGLPILFENNPMPIVTNGNQGEVIEKKTSVRRESISYEESSSSQQVATSFNRPQQPAAAASSTNKSPRQDQQQQQQSISAMNLSEYPKNNSCVMLTGFRSPNRCYIRSLLPHDNESFLKISKSITELGRNSSKLINVPKVGEYALTTFKSDSILYRVEVIGVRNPNMIRVLYIDYGNTAVKKLSELRKINDDIIRLKKYVVPVALKDVPNYALDEKLSKFLEEFENFECRVEYTKKDERVGLMECVLKSWNSNQNINEELIRFARSDGNSYCVRNADKDVSFDNEKKDDYNRGAVGGGGAGGGDKYKKSQYEQKSNVNEGREKISERLDKIRTTSEGDKQQQQQQPKHQQQNKPSSQQQQQQQSKPQQEQQRCPRKEDFDGPQRSQTRDNNEKVHVSQEKTTEIPQTKTSNNANGNQQKSDELKEVKTSTASGGQKPVLDPPFETILFKTGDENFQVIPLDTSLAKIGCFGCLAIADLKTFQKIQEYTSNFKDTERPYRPVLNEYCLAKFEDEWYRAKVIECSEDLSEFTVTYIDYTNEGIVTPKEIRRYPDDLTLPCCSNLCMIEGLPEELSPNQIKFLQSKLEAFKITHNITKVKGVEENVPIIQMNEVIDELQSKSLL